MLFVFVRVLSILMMVPFFGGPSAPAMVKVGISLTLAFVITPMIGILVPIPDNAAALAIGVFREVLLGLAIGFLVKLVFTAVEIAGQVTGMQMGLGIANVIDPQTSSQMSVLSQFYNLSGILLFFSLNAHLIFIFAIKESFAIVPPYSFSITGGMTQDFLFVTGEMFKIAVKIAAPIMVSILLVNVAMGVMARTVPQLNIFVVGFPITITLGIVVLLFSLPFVFSVLSAVYMDLLGSIINMMRASAL